MLAFLAVAAMLIIPAHDDSHRADAPVSYAVCVEEDGSGTEYACQGGPSEGVRYVIINEGHGHRVAVYADGHIEDSSDAATVATRPVAITESATRPIAPTVSRKPARTAHMAACRNAAATEGPVPCYWHGRNRAESFRALLVGHAHNGARCVQYRYGDGVVGYGWADPVAPQDVPAWLRKCH